ncbi:hypothetical protein MC885_019399 [Smutsia gigantea]|nr:hypothetical protein MC885_019399 [Smutsia gigantea]
MEDDRVVAALQGEQAEAEHVAVADHIDRSGADLLEEQTGLPSWATGSTGIPFPALTPTP